MPRRFVTGLPALLLLALAACGDARTDSENVAASGANNSQAANAVAGEPVNAAAPDDAPPAATAPAAETTVSDAQAPLPARRAADPQGETRSDPVPPPQPAPRQGLDPHADHPPGNHMR